MSLKIYRDRTGLDVVDNNDAYFIGYSKLVNDDFTNMVLKYIDHAERVSDVTFIGRTPEFGALFKQNLSTGTKTLLNIAQHPNTCFNVVECGNNALNMLRYLHEGQIYWQYPILMLDDIVDDGESCDFEYKGVVYTNVQDFTEVVMNESC